MKNFLALMGAILVLMIFPLQDALDIKNDNTIDRFNDAVYRATEKARIDGYFTQENINELKSNILAHCPDLAESDIFINVTTTPKYRINVFDKREAIYYDIRIPIKKIVAAAPLLGISAEENQFIYPKQGYVLSEVNSP